MLLLQLQKRVLEISIVLFTLFTFFHFCYSYQFVKFMTGILGKLLIVILIIFYTSISEIYGLLFCLLAILFYQMDSTKWIMEGFIDTSSLCRQGGSCGCGGGCSGQSSKCKKNKPNNHETTYLSVIDLEDNVNNRRKTDFQKRHCSVDGILTYKDIPVKKDMSAIVFPEIVYGDDICNPCDKNCEFKVN